MFGPIGIVAIYYSALARGHADDPMIWHAASGIVFGSILTYGVTAAPLTRLYGRKQGSAPDKAGN